MNEKKRKLVEFQIAAPPFDLPDQQYVIEAGGCLHIAFVHGGRLCVSGSRRPTPIRGVTRAWGLEP